MDQWEIMNALHIIIYNDGSLEKKYMIKNIYICINYKPLKKKL